MASCKMLRIQKTPNIDTPMEATRPATQTATVKEMIIRLFGSISDTSFQQCLINILDPTFWFQLYLSWVTID